MKALVTGATGFIGSHLVERLLEGGAEVRCLVRLRSDQRWLQEHPVELVTGDCLAPESLVPAVRGVDAVFHLAGVVRARREEDFFASNALGTRNLLQVCLRHGQSLGKFVLVSSQAAAGPSPDGRPLNEDDACQPISAYGRSKLAGEAEVLAEKDRLPLVVVRPSPVYGPRDRDFFSLFKMIVRGFRPIIGGEERYLHLTHVRDVVEGIWLAARKEIPSGRIYFLADERSYSWRALGEALSVACQRRTRLLYIPRSLTWLVARLSELWAALMRRPAMLNRDKRREMLARYWLCDTRLARTELGFTIGHPLVQGAADTLRWYRAQGWL